MLIRYLFTVSFKTVNSIKATFYYHFLYLKLYFCKTKPRNYWKENFNETLYL